MTALVAVAESLTMVTSGSFGMRVFGVVGLPMTAACSGSRVSVLDTPADGGIPGTDGGISAHGALKILSATATVKTLTLNPTNTKSSTTDIASIVTDSLGLDAIAGGRIQDAEGHPYASFGTGSTKVPSPRNLSGMRSTKYAPWILIAVAARARST